MIEYDPPDKFIGTTAAIILGISAAVSTYGGIHAANVAKDAQKQALDATTTAADKQLTFAQSEAQRDQANFASTQAENQREFNLTQGLNLDQYNQKENRLAPFRSIGANANNTLSGMLGYAPTASYTPAPPPTPATFLPTTYAPGATPTPASGVPTSSTAGVPIPTGASSGVPTNQQVVPNGDYQAWFQSLTGGKPLNQSDLVALTPQLTQAGVKVTSPSKAGVMSKIILPDGTAVRVLNGDTSQRNQTVWLPQPGTGPSAGGGNSMLSFLAPPTPQTPTPVQAPLTPALTTAMPQAQPGTLASFLRPSLSA